jgi:DNA-binding NtrC family response regulator
MKKQNLTVDYNELIRSVLESSLPPPFDKKDVKKKITAALKEKFLERETESFQVFDDKEFNNDAEVEKLCRLIKNDYPRLSLSITTGTVKWLNKLLEIGHLYETVREKHGEIKFDNNIKKLIQETSVYRPNVFEYLGNYKRMKIIRLNRLLIEAIYPENAPKFIDHFYRAKICDYMGPYAREAFRDVFIDDIEKRYFLDYRVADMALQHEGIFDLMLIDYKRMIELYGYRKYPSDFSRQIYHRANLDVPLIIVGETGTGKELCARAIHLMSKRRSAPFIEINCAAIPENLLEAELFGVIENYPGLHNTQPLMGKIEQAEEGIIFLDELGKMQKNLQAKILKVVDEKKVSRLGGETTMDINIRFIAAIQPKDIIDDRILPDLKYRLGYPDIINMPTLNKRIKDLGEELLYDSLKRTISKTGAINPELKIDSTLVNALVNHTYEGNFRELEAIYRMAIINAKTEATPHKHWPIKYDDFCAGTYVKQITEKNIPGLNQAFVKDQLAEEIKHLDDSIEKIPLKSIVAYAEKNASDIIEKRVFEIVKEGRNIKDVLISEGVSIKEYQNILGKIKRYMGKGINDLKRMHAQPSE